MFKKIYRLNLYWDTYMTGKKLPRSETTGDYVEFELRGATLHKEKL
ncbi:MAG: hypothetical protein V1909_01360 [Candidatus Micrarchaeota archaeon]